MTDGLRKPTPMKLLFVTVGLLLLVAGGVFVAFDWRHYPPLEWQPLVANLPRRAGNVTPLSTEPAFSKLRFVDPTYITPIPDGSDRLVVVERCGRIYAFSHPEDAATKTLYLDISDRTMQLKDRAEDGLFGIAFHPEYHQANSPHRGEFFVHYTANIDGRRFNRLSKFRVTEGGDVADASSEVVLIHTPDDNQTHNGGTVTFGPDGFLYLALGDDGKHHPNPNAQNIRGELLSGILRIDPDCRGGDVSHPPPRQPLAGKTAGYYIPNDNPFVGITDALEEFYAIGLRNPWRISFDPQGRLWASDVGDLRREEINLIKSGSNCGWNYAEGTLLCSSYDPRATPKPAPYLGHETWPVFEYERDAMNRCIIGGYVYRGSQFPELRGKYVYADQSGRIYALTVNANDQPPSNELIAVIGEPGLGISSFGEDANGELFICVIKDLAQETGEIYHLVSSPSNPSEQLPQWLSETKLFDDLPTLKPSAGLVAYDVNSPLWSDRAVKQRWIGLPPGGKIEGELRGPWKFPVGTVFVKHFDLPLEEQAVGGKRQAANGNLSGSEPETLPLRRLETRLVVCDDRGAVYAATYRWKEDLSDAKLVNYSETEDIEYTDAEGQKQTQKWLYPGRFECLSCHNQPANYVLGFNAKQLNRNVAVEGDSQNQLQRFASAGLLDMSCSNRAIRKTPTLVAIDDPHASLETRVRSYLDSNCSHCHRPGHRFGAWDGRFESQLDFTGIVNGTSNMHRSSNKKARIVRPGDLSLSFLHVRLTSNDMTLKMPPLGRNVIDGQAAEAVAEWIQSLPPPTAEIDAKLEAEYR